MSTPVLYDSHMHTPLCKHAHGFPEAYAAQAQKAGLKGIIFTCHNPGPPGWSEQVRMSLDQLPEYIRLVEETRQAWQDQIDIRLGLESDFVPGIEPFLEKLHAQAEFHYILGSVHPHLPYYKEQFYQGDVSAFQHLYFEHLALAAESGLYQALAHPDLVKNVFPQAWRLDLLLDDIRRCLDRIAQTGIAMELNTSGLNKRIQEMNPSPQILAEMQQRGIPVVLGSDAHSPQRVAADFLAAMDLLEEAGYTHLTYFLEQKPHQVSIQSAYNSLLARKTAQTL